MLQTCVPSKEIIFDDKPYRPTGRVVITATFNDEHSLPILTCLGGYWELPIISTDISFTTLALISPHGDFDDCQVIPIDPTDFRKINQEINQYLPSILLEMYTTPLALLEQKFSYSPMMQSYSKYLRITNLSQQSQDTRISDPELRIARMFNKELESISDNIEETYFLTQMINYEGCVPNIQYQPLPATEAMPLEQRKDDSRGSPLRQARERRQPLDTFLCYSTAGTILIALSTGSGTREAILLIYGILLILTLIYLRDNSLEENDIKPNSP